MKSRALFSTEEARRIARRKLPRTVFEFVDGGATHERTLHDNTAAFARWQFMPRLAVDTSGLNVDGRLLGQPCALPLVIAPMGLVGLLWPGGEIEMARAAAKFGIPFCLSTMSVASLEEVAAAAPAHSRWFQLYIITDRSRTDGLVDRAEASGYETLCLSVDQPTLGRRWRDMRNGWKIPLSLGPRAWADFGMHLPWTLRALMNPIRFGNLDTTPGSAVASAKRASYSFDRTVCWDDVSRLRKRWRGKLVVKGLLSPHDAEEAVQRGADAIVVSNHGGRQLDDVPAPLDALEPIADQVRGRAEVIVDGGVRSGGDIVKARALGATACMAGRPLLWALTCAGQSGVTEILETLRDEVVNTMTLLGRPDLGDLDKSILIRRAG